MASDSIQHPSPMIRDPWVPYSFLLFHRRATHKRMFRIFNLWRCFASEVTAVYPVVAFGIVA